MSAAPSDDIVRLSTAKNPVAAHILGQALLDEGIRVQVVGDYLNAGLGNIPGVQPELWVHRDDLARAEKILERLEQENPPTPEES